MNMTREYQELLKQNQKLQKLVFKQQSQLKLNKELSKGLMDVINKQTIDLQDFIIKKGITNYEKNSTN